ncbi:sigma-70 family RNA polymerase sigma factor [Variovorax sp. YR566]|uniref:sigma-70 family RNA polymerase sigma factor n=1 Tax=Variovorax sp. YR566 TaxID=3450237 RepID=UPI003F80D4FB
MPRLSSTPPLSPLPFFEAKIEEGMAEAATADTLDLTTMLWQRWREKGDEGARAQLIEHHLPYARMMAATVYGRRTHNDVEFADYLQLARIGLIEAVDRFDPAQGAQFRTFAARRVQGAILNGLPRLTEKNQQISTMMRLRHERLEAIKEAASEDVSTNNESAPSDPASSRDAEKLFRYLAEVGIGIALGVLLEDTGMVDAEAFDSDGHSPSPEVSYFRKSEIHQLRNVLRGLVDQLNDRQKTVIRYHYLQEISFSEIASSMNLTRGRVSQLHREGLLRLRELLGKDARCDVSW